MPKRSTSTARKTTVKKKTSTSKRASTKSESTQAAKQWSVTSFTSSQSFKTNIRNPRLWIGLAVVVLVVLAYLFRGLFVVASVNGQPISRLAVIQTLERQSGQQALQTLISQQLIFQQAQKEGISVSQAEVDTELKQLDSSLKQQGQDLNTALATRGMSKADLESQIKIQKLVEKMVGKDVKITDKDVQDYIDKNKDSLPQNMSEDQLKAQVKQQLQQQALTTKTQEWLSNLQKNAKILYFVNY